MYIKKEFQKAITEMSPRIAFRMSLDNEVITSIENGLIIDSSWDFISDSFVGEFPLWKLKATFLYTSTKKDYIGKEFHCEVGAYRFDDGWTNEIEWLTLGYFTVPEEGQSTDEILKQVELTMYDRGVSLDKRYKPLDFPLTGLQLRKEIARRNNLVLNNIASVLPYDDYVFDSVNVSLNDAITDREVLRQYAQLNMSSVFVNRYGLLEFKSVFTGEVLDVAIDNNDYSSLTHELVYGPINSLIYSNKASGDEQSYQEIEALDDTSVSEHGKKYLEFSNNIFLDVLTLSEQQTQINKLFTLVNGFSYAPFEVEYFARPDFDPYDKIKVVDMEGNSGVIPITSMSFNYNGGLTGTLKTKRLPETLPKNDIPDIFERVTNAEIRVNRSENKITSIVSDIGDREDKTTTITQDIEGVVSEVKNVHQGNNIPNLNGNIDLVGWQGTTGRLKGITVPYRIKGIQNLRGNMNAYPVQSKQFLSTWGLEFYGPGEMISPSGAIVTDDEYSWKGRILPFKPFTVKAYEQKEYGYDLYLKNPLQQGSLNQNTGLELDSDNRVRSSKFLKVSSGTLDIIKSNVNFKYLVRMYDSNYEFLSGGQPWISDTNKSVNLNKGTRYIKIVIGRTNDANITPDDIPSELLSIYDENARPFKETEFKFDSPQEYNQFTMQPHNDTKFVRLGFSIPNATLDSRVTLTEMMFNMGQPKDWFASPNDIKALTESYRLQTANEIKDVVKNVEVIDGKTVENYTIIQQLSNQIVLAVNSQGRLVAVELGVDPNTGSYIVLKADNISLEGLTTINGGFKVLENGNIEFVDAIGRNVDISGRITAISGEIGGYTISGSNLVGNDVTLGRNEIFLKNARISSGQNTDHIYIYGRGLYIGENNSGSVISGSARALTFSVPGTTFSPVMYNDNQSRGLFDNITPFNGSASAKYLGSSGKRYTNIYLTNQPNVSSDERHKKNILDIDNDLIQIFGQEVKPKTYMMNGSHEIHFGYIAQDVERALFKYNLRKHGLNRANLMMEEFAVLSKDESYMSLLYGEIAVIMDAYNRKRSDDLEKRIKKIEGLLLERND